MGNASPLKQPVYIFFFKEFFLVSAFCDLKAMLCNLSGLYKSRESSAMRPAYPSPPNQHDLVSLLASLIECCARVFERDSNVHPSSPKDLYILRPFPPTHTAPGTPLFQQACYLLVHSMCSGLHRRLHQETDGSVPEIGGQPLSLGSVLAPSSHFVHTITS